MSHILQLETPCEMHKGVTKNKPFIYEDNTELRNKDFSNLFTQVLALPPKDTKKAAFSTLCSDLLDYCCHRHLRSPSKKKKKQEHPTLPQKKKKHTGSSFAPFFLELHCTILVTKGQQNSEHASYFNIH